MGVMKAAHLRDINRATDAQDAWQIASSYFRLKLNGSRSQHDPASRAAYVEAKYRALVVDVAEPMRLVVTRAKDLALEELAPPLAPARPAEAGGRRRSYADVLAQSPAGSASPTAPPAASGPRGGLAPPQEGAAGVATPPAATPQVFTSYRDALLRAPPTCPANL